MTATRSNLTFSRIALLLVLVPFAAVIALILLPILLQVLVAIITAILSFFANL